MRTRNRFLVLTLAIGAPLAAAGGRAPAESSRTPSGKIDFERDIRPILVDRCQRCHGPRRQRGGLRLDHRSDALRGGDSGAVIVPGQSAESRLFRLVAGLEEDLVMPPSGERLDAREVGLVREWIDGGAAWPPDGASAAVRRVASDHWAYQPVQRPSLPEPGGPRAVPPQRIRNAIDVFIERRLRAASLDPLAEADRSTLLRRASLDLTGLPPTPAEIDAFLDDPRPDAYERVVDRLLASPHHGERWAQHWLDVARYADSNGFTTDNPRSIWPYRDWVIDALNAGMSFDRFTVEQLAGDLLPEAGVHSRVATGFHRNTLINEEGGTDREQFRVEAVADRVDTTGTVWLGLTIGCARCHSHKFDPITQREYYQLFAFFNGDEEPAMTVPTREQVRRREDLEARLEAALERLGIAEEDAAGRREAWERRLVRESEVTWHDLEDVRVESVEGTRFRILEDGSHLVHGEIPDRDTYRVEGRVDLASLTAIRLDVLTHESLPQNGPGLAGNGNFVLTGLRASVGERGLEIVGSQASHSQKGYPVSAAIDGDAATGWAINVERGNMNVSRRAVFRLGDATTLWPGVGGRLVIELEHALNDRYLVGRFRIRVTDAPPGVLLVAADVRQALAVPAGERSVEDEKRIEAAFRASDPVLAALASETTAIRRELAALEKQFPRTMVLERRSRPRQTHVHIRGDFLRKGDPVAPDVPAVLPPLQGETTAPTRLDLARWLVYPANPLTARVTVNRIWQRYFGRGLVETENDFGVQGARPTHPELLDWLASEFVRTGWDLKRLHRLIVTSATYRRSSLRIGDAALRLEAVDPRNELLGRQNRLRLAAESIRDGALVASGLLTRQIGGPGVYPPQPDGIATLTQVRREWKESEGAPRYRRGMYTFFWRSNPHPFFTTFDKPEGVVTCTRRARSNTPLQALTLANSRAVMEFARALSRRLLVAEGDRSDRARVELTFRWCLGRQPSGDELDRLERFVVQQRRELRADPAAARALAPSALPSGDAMIEGAAWTGVARVLLNLDEFITRE